MRTDVSILRQEDPRSIYLFLIDIACINTNKLSNLQRLSRAAAPLRVGELRTMHRLLHVSNLQQGQQTQYHTTVDLYPFIDPVR